MSKEVKALESLGGSRSQQLHSVTAPSSAPDIATSEFSTASGSSHPLSNSVDPVASSYVNSRVHHGQAQPSTAFSPTPTRSLGVHSILNPAQPASEGAEAAISSPSLTTYGAESSGVHMAFPTSPRSGKHSQRALLPDRPSSSARTNAPRRSLTPISPGQRLESIGNCRKFPESTFGPGTASFTPGAGRAHTTELGHYPKSDIPQLPSTQQENKQPRPSQTPADVIGPSGVFGGPYARDRQSRSPGTPDSMYSQFRQPPSGFQYGSTPVNQQGYQALQPAPTGGHYAAVSISRASEGSQYADGNQNSLQMTLNTEQGPMLVPVDVQQASRTANEKRKRNACASARFRARRKEKEREASHTILGLERDMRDLADECDFYRQERDYFRELLTRYLDLSQLSPRPASPHARRTSFLSSASNDIGLAPFQEQYRDSPESPGPAPIRRRTVDLSRLAGAPVSMSPMLPPTRFSSQPPVPMGALPPMARPPPLPSPFMDTRMAPPGMPPPLPPPPPLGRSQSYDPFRPDRFDRSWDPGR